MATWKTLVFVIGTFVTVRCQYYDYGKKYYLSLPWTLLTDHVEVKKTLDRTQKNSMVPRLSKIVIHPID